MRSAPQALRARPRQDEGHSAPDVVVSRTTGSRPACAKRTASRSGSRIRRNHVLYHSQAAAQVEQESSVKPPGYASNSIGEASYGHRVNSTRSVFGTEAPGLKPEDRGTRRPHVTAGPLFPRSKSRGLVRLAIFRYVRRWVGHGRRTLGGGKDALHETTRVEGPAASERRGLLDPRSESPGPGSGDTRARLETDLARRGRSPFAVRVGPRRTRSFST